jgi:pectate lyase
VISRAVPGRARGHCGATATLCAIATREHRVVCAPHVRATKCVSIRSRARGTPVARSRFVSWIVSLAIVLAGCTVERSPPIDVRRTPPTTEPSDREPRVDAHRPPIMIDGGFVPEPDASPGEPPPAMPELVSLLDEIEGWATGTTGGRDGTVFVVDTLADDGPRSLRAALTAIEPLWIVFAPGLDGTITLETTIRTASDKTVDARGHDIHIRTRDHFTAIQIRSQSNLVFANLRLDDELADWDRDTEGADGITIHNSHHIWIHHCTFARWLDGAVDIRHDPTMPGERPSYISITWSRFERIYQALNWTADHVSFGHNHCDRVRRRCVQIIGGRAHSYGNVISEWNAAAIQTSKDGGELLSQNNIFVPAGAIEVNARVNGGRIDNRQSYTIGRVTFVGGNDDIDPTFVSESRALARLATCSAADTACWTDLRNDIESHAGTTH